MCFVLLLLLLFYIFILATYNPGEFKHWRKKQNWIRSSVCAVCSRQTVMQKDSIEALHQNRNPLVQEAGLSNLARVFRDPPSKIVKEVTRWCVKYDTIGEFNVDWKAEYSALSSTRSQKKKLKQPTPVPLWYRSVSQLAQRCIRLLLLLLCNRQLRTGRVNVYSSYIGGS